MAADNFHHIGALRTLEILAAVASIIIMYNYNYSSVAALVTYQPRNMHPAMLPFTDFGTLRPVLIIIYASSGQLLDPHSVCYWYNTIYCTCHAVS